MRTVLGFPIPSESRFFLAVLAIHVLAGLGAVVTGAAAMVTAKGPGRHPRFGSSYLGCLVVVAATMGILSAMRWAEDYHLFVLGFLSLAAAVIARRAVRQRAGGWALVHIVGMGSSYVLLVTAFYVDNGKHLPLWRDLPAPSYWLIPSAIGVPLMVWAGWRHPLARADRRAAGQVLGSPKTLTSAEARAFYDHFGRKQDRQGFYEDPAVDDLVAHAGFEHAQQVFEFGCGTGRLAERLLRARLPDSATYFACDLSPVMLGLARSRLAPFGIRVRLAGSEGGVQIPAPDGSVDRVLSTYVLDLLSGNDSRRFFDEAHRVLVPGGMLCLAGLTPGVTPASRLMTGLWDAVFRLRPSLVGGCRPVSLASYADSSRWRAVHRRVVVAFGVPSEVLILRAQSGSGSASERSLPTGSGTA